MGRFGRICARRCMFLMCDIQKKFGKEMPLFSNLVANAQRLTIAGKTLEIPLLVSELCPRVNGRTIRDINIDHGCLVMKSQFSMYTKEIEDEMREHFCGNLPRDVVLYGLETHTSILMTALDFLHQKVHVYVVADCCLSRNNQDRDIAFQTLRDAGCVLTTAETMMCALMRDTSHPKYRELGKVLGAQSCDMDISLNYSE